MCHHGSPMVQCSPVQPWWQSHLPSRQTPWSMQRGWQSLCSHSGPVQPSSQWHTPLMQEPWGPQSTTHTSVAKQRAMETCSFCSLKSPFSPSLLDSCIFVCWIDASANAEKNALMFAKCELPQLKWANKFNCKQDIKTVQEKSRHCKATTSMSDTISSKESKLLLSVKRMFKTHRYTREMSGLCCFLVRYGSQWTCCGNNSF